jgi:DNA-binding NtrC family response regulator/tetratricopeptide (TPR) repeat protein
MKPLDAVFLGTPVPYPLAALEPFVACLLRGEYAAREWMSGRLPKGTAVLNRELRDLMRASEHAGWVLWPRSALDTESVSVLERCARDLAKPLWVLSEREGATAGRIARLHLLWMPSAGEAWYLEHAEALLGPTPEAWLRAILDLPSDQPRPGAPLFPPTPRERLKPHRPWTGNTPAEAGPTSSGRRVPARSDEPRELARRCELATLLLSARALRDRGEKAAGAYWEGTAFLLMGQAKHAISLWRECGGAPVPAADLAVARGRALERLQDYPGVLGQVREAEAAGAEGATRDQTLLLKGQAQWLCGKAREARTTLEGVLRASKEPETRAQALCHLAVLALHSNRVEEALGLIEGARRATPAEASPFTHFLVAHRSGMAYQRMGEFARALDLFRQAGQRAASAGLRVHEAGCEADCGNALRRLGRFDEAAACYRRCAEGALCLDLESLAQSARFNLGLCALEAGDVLGAKRVFEEAAPPSIPASNPVFQAIDCYWLGVVSQQLGDYPAALEWAERGLACPDGLCDPEVRPPLLLLKGEVLLLTGQNRKLAYLLDQLGETLTPRSEPDDRLAALALRTAAARRGSGPPAASLEREALALLPSCSPYFRALWQLLSARDERGLCQAWEQAREARSAYLACRALAALAERGALPRLSPREREWLLEYLIRNRVRGAERSLVPLLAEPPEAGRAEPALSLDPLEYLARSAVIQSDSVEELLTLSGAQAACVLPTGQPPAIWGECGADQRRALLEAPVAAGEIPAPGGRIFSAIGRAGFRAAFFKSGSDPFPARSRALLGLWVKLRTPPEAPEPPAPPANPAMARFLLTRSPAMAPVLESLQRAAAFGFPVLLSGEPGVGKEACARALHAASGRARKEWMPFNCANLTATLATSQLFGHRRGSFTGAERDHVGLVEAARDSTLFMDEVGELPLEVQPHLLRFLQDGSFLPLGETRSRVSNARVVAATNRDLERAVSDGRFREDLFHRLNVLPIRIPPLRERPEDVPLLFEHFLREAAQAEGLAPPGADPAALARLAAYSWPGNVRELQNAARAALVTSHPCTLIREKHLPSRILSRSRTQEGGRTFAARVHEAERSILEQALREAGGNLSAAARVLGLSRQGLFAKLKRLGMK